MIIKGRWRAELVAQLYALHSEIQGKTCTPFGTSGTCNNKYGGMWVMTHSEEPSGVFRMKRERAKPVIPPRKKNIPIYYFQDTHTYTHTRARGCTHAHTHKIDACV